MTYRFGDILDNGYASSDNPIRRGIFVRKVSKGLECTNGKGKFWTISKDNPRITKLGNVLTDDSSIQKIMEGQG